MNDSRIRLTAVEQQICLQACQYALVPLTMHYAKDKMLLNGIADQFVNLSFDPQAEISERDSRNLKRLKDEVSIAKDECRKHIAKYEKTLSLVVKLQGRFINSPGDGDFSFNREECDFIATALREYNVAEIEPLINNDLIVGVIEKYLDPDTDEFRENFQSTARPDRNVINARRDALTILQGKILSYAQSIPQRTTDEGQ